METDIGNFSEESLGLAKKMPKSIGNHLLKETNYLRQTIRLVLNLCRNFIRIQLIFSIDSVVYFLELPIGYNTSSTVAIILINYLSKEIN